MLLLAWCLWQRWPHASEDGEKSCCLCPFHVGNEDLELLGGKQIATFVVADLGSHLAVRSAACGVTMGVKSSLESF